MPSTRKILLISNSDSNGKSLILKSTFAVIGGAMP
jgi:hypothetical protein